MFLNDVKNFLQSLLIQKIISHVKNHNAFEDGFHFYKFDDGILGRLSLNVENGKKNFLRTKVRIEAVINSTYSNLNQSLYKMPTGHSFNKLKPPINDNRDENDSDSDSNDSNKNGYEAYKDPESLNSITGNYSSTLAGARKLLEQNNNDNIASKNESTLSYTQPTIENYNQIIVPTEIKSKEKRKSGRSENKHEKVESEKKLKILKVYILKFKN